MKDEQALCKEPDNMHEYRLFSIIIPAYNAEKYIYRCLVSISKQTCKDYELIIVDDGSTDRTLRIIERYASKRPEVKILHQDNQGNASARKAGLIVAQGEYVVYVDADDWVSSNYLESFQSIIEKYDSPDMISVGIKHVAGQSAKMVYSTYKPGYYNREQLENSIYPGLIEGKDGRYFEPSVCAKAIRRRIAAPFILRVTGEHSIGEDAAVIWPCLYHCSSLYILHEALYCYRRHRGGVTGAGAAISWEAVESVMDSIRSGICATLGDDWENIIDLKKLENLPEDNSELDKYDLLGQIYRNAVHWIFNTASSQFSNQSRSYLEIRQDIISHLEKKKFRKAIKNCTYDRYWQGRFASAALKYRLILLMKIYNAYNSNKRR